jgi:thymidylate synthase (FAD)
MKIIRPSVEIIPLIPAEAMLRHIETCGRVCYKSEERIGEGSAEAFVRGLIARGHESVLEHCSITVRIICDRGVSHELVRHRLASYSQESTRYCNYSRDKFGGEITVVESASLERSGSNRKWYAWYKGCLMAEETYFQMLDEGCTPQEARAVLPNSLKTEVMMTANIREWRHILKLRTSQAAHPDMRRIMVRLYEMLVEYAPVLFEDIGEGAE